MKERIYLSYQFESDNSNESDITMAESFEEGATIQQVLTLVEKFMRSCGYQFDGALVITDSNTKAEKHDNSNNTNNPITYHSDTSGWLERKVRYNGTYNG